MKVLVLLACMAGTMAQANDGGQAAIKVSEIKMREYNERGEEKRRITHPNFRIFIKGQEAAKLQYILPSSVSVVTSMYPEVKDEYDRTFKALGIYSVASSVTGKVVNISCQDGELVEGANGRSKIKKWAEPTCEISINQTDEASDWFGDKQDYNPSCTP